MDCYHLGLLVHLEAPEHVVFNAVVASESSIREKIREEFDRLRLAKLFRGTHFVFPETSHVPWQHGE
jgi:hypothetical protein